MIGLAYYSKNVSIFNLNRITERNGHEFSSVFDDLKTLKQRFRFLFILIAKTKLRKHDFKQYVILVNVSIF